MRIDYIKLRSYRQYRDEKIVFTQPEGSRNFTIIQGATGVGKTNILNALTWCLYGREKHLREEKYKGLPILNTIVLDELNPGESCEVEVEIKMLDEEDNKMVFRRTLAFRKSEGGGITKIPLADSPDGSKFEMLKQKGKDMIIVFEPQYVLKRLIPESLERYFFFDGEKLNEYFTATDIKKIRKEVEKISQLGLLDDIIRHLDYKRKEFLKAFKGFSPKAKEIGEKIEILEKSFERHNEELEEKKKQKEEVTEKEEEYSEKLRTSSIPDIRKLEEERKRIERDLDNLENEIKELEKDEFNYLLTIAPSIFAYDPIVKTKRLIERGEEAGDIPPDYKKNFLEKLLEGGKCICGTDISEENERRKSIEQLLHECSDISDISEELIRENANLRSIIENLKGFHDKQIWYGKRLNELERERRSKSERLKIIHEEIKDYDIEKITLWEHKLKEYKKLKEELIEEIGNRKARIEETEKEISELRSKLDKEAGKEDKYKKIKKTRLFIEKSLEVSNEIKKEIMEDVRKEVEEKTKRQFFDLMWKKEDYNDVKIDQEYNVSVMHKSGIEGIGTLSAGESQVLALSFMGALNIVSGFNVPIIIDTPLGRLSKEPKKNIADNLPKYLEEKQVTLLVTEEEYTPEVREKLSERVGKEYRIVFKEAREGGEAKVISYD